MASKKRLRKTRSITLDGKKFELRLNNTAVADIHQHTGINLYNPKKAEGDESGDLQRMLEPANFGTVVWAMLGGEDFEHSMREVGTWLDLDNMEEVSTAIFALINGDDEGDSKNAGEG